MPYIVRNTAGDMISSIAPLETTRDRGLAIRTIDLGKARDWATQARFQLEGEGRGKRMGWQVRRADRVR